MNVMIPVGSPSRNDLDRQLWMGRGHHRHHCEIVLGAKHCFSGIPTRTCLCFTKDLDLLCMVIQLADCCFENP